MHTAADFNVTILYESIDARKQAERFSDRFAANRPTAGNLNLSLWNFRGLGRREVRNTSASTAACADAVIFSMRGTATLPRPVERWVEMWIWLIDGRKPALHALFATHHPESARVRSYLRKGAVSKGLAFFPHTHGAVVEIDGAGENVGIQRPHLCTTTSKHRRTNPMPLSLTKSYGRKLGASDGNIGSVEDFYFEDQRWAIRYVVADTGSWLPGRQILLSPYAFGQLDGCADCLPVNLTRAEIENSPSIELHKPVSRQYEEAYHAYYQWPPYWNGGGLWGVGEYPTNPPPHLKSDERPHRDFASAQSKADDPHLRSTRSVVGHEVQARDGVIGHVTDFLVDDYGWMIRYLVVEAGAGFAGREIQISPRDVDRVSYEESKVFLKVTRGTLLKFPEIDLPAAKYEETLGTAG